MTYRSVAGGAEIKATPYWPGWFSCEGEFGWKFICTAKHLEKHYRRVG